jgi:hypothetical protein
MAEQIRSLQVSVNAASLRKREEATELEDYQKQVAKMQRLMVETRQVSECKIRALTNEVEELRPVNAALRGEIEALRRHLALALGELKNPIIIPPPRDMEGSEFGDGKDAVEKGREGDEKENVVLDDGDLTDEEDSGYDDDDLAKELHAQANEFLKDLGLFRRKVGDDCSRFGPTEALSEVYIN